MAMAVGLHLGPCTSDRAAGTKLSTTAIEPAARSTSKNVLMNSFAMGDVIYVGDGNSLSILLIFFCSIVYIRSVSTAGSIDTNQEPDSCN